MGTVRITVVPGVVLLLLLGTSLGAQEPAGQAPPGRTVVEYRYGGAGSLQGHFEGSCEARGITFSEGVPLELSIRSDGGWAELRTTWVNFTVLRPAAGPPTVLVQPDRMVVSNREIPAGAFSVETRSVGEAVVFPLGFGRERGPLEDSFRVHGSAHELETSEVDLATPAPINFWRSVGDDVGISEGEFHGWNRAVRWTGPAPQVEGHLSIYVRGAAWTTADGRATHLDPYQQEETNLTTPAVERKTLRFTDAFLDLQHARWTQTPSDVHFICGALQGRVAGAGAFSEATGSVRQERQWVNFTGQVVTISGEFDLDEHPPAGGGAEADRGWMEARAEGRVQVVGIDFAPIPSPAALPMSAPEALGLAALLAVVWILARHLGDLVGLLYARVLGAERVLAHEGRRRLYDTIEQQPGLDLTQLAHQTGYFLTTVTYHLAVLKRNDLVHLVRYKNAVRVLPKDARFASLRAGIPREVILGDDRMRFVQDQVLGQPRSQGDLARLVASRFGLTLRGARSLIARAEERGIIERSTDQGRVWIRCAS